VLTTSPGRQTPVSAFTVTEIAVRPTPPGQAHNPQAYNPRNLSRDGLAGPHTEMAHIRWRAELHPSRLCLACL
jgi:hypothetical protein